MPTGGSTHEQGGQRVEWVVRYVVTVGRFLGYSRLGFVRPEAGAPQLATVRGKQLVGIGFPQFAEIDGIERGGDFMPGGAELALMEQQ